MAEAVHNKSVGQSKQAKNKKATKSIIGIVKFFDTTKDFGFIVTNSLYVPGISDRKNELCNFHVASSGLVYPLPL